MRSKEELSAIVRGAFRPLTCETEHLKFDEGLRLRVLDLRGMPIGGPRTIAWPRFEDEALIENDLDHYRFQIAAASGVELEPWSFPPVKDDHA